MRAGLGSWCSVEGRGRRERVVDLVVEHVIADDLRNPLPVHVPRADPELGDRPGMALSDQESVQFPVCGSV